MIAAALAADPSEPAAHALEGFLHDLCKRTEEAVASYRAALYLDPALFQVRVLLADCLLRLGNRDRAEHQFREVLTLLASGREKALLLFGDLPLPDRERAQRRCRQVLKGGSGLESSLRRPLRTPWRPSVPRRLRPVLPRRSARAERDGGGVPPARRTAGGRNAPPKQSSLRTRATSTRADRRQRLPRARRRRGHHRAGGPPRAVPLRADPRAGAAGGSPVRHPARRGAGGAGGRRRRRSGCRRSG